MVLSLQVLAFVLVHPGILFECLRFLRWERARAHLRICGPRRRYCFAISPGSAWNRRGALTRIHFANFLEQKLDEEPDARTQLRGGIGSVHINPISVFRRSAFSRSKYLWRDAESDVEPKYRLIPRPADLPTMTICEW